MSGEQSVTIPGGYVAGMTWGWPGVRGTWTGDKAASSMELMVERTGVNWTAVTFAAYQDTPFSTDVRFRAAPTVTDEEVIRAIRAARALGQYVCVKPVVNCADGAWRAHINFFDVDVPCEPKWSDWFATYTAFMLHYARLAQAEGAQMLCVGCEMVQADRRSGEWRALVAAVRKVYGGLVTYNCDKYQESNVQWWDAVDVISSSGYYPFDDWTAQLDRIGRVVAAHGKPFMFMEAGCPSREGSPLLPHDWRLNGAPSEAAQREFYEAMFTACGEREWMHGFMLWDWPADLYDEAEASASGDYCVFGKQAEATVRDYYASKIHPRAPLAFDHGSMA